MPADPIHMQIISSDGAVFERMVRYISIPTDAGPVGVLSGHLPMFCAFEQGLVMCRFGQDESLRIRVGSGVAKVADNEVTLLVASAEMQ